MRQASLKIKSYGNFVNIINNSDLNKRALRFIIISFGILAVFYVAILGTMTFNIVERRAMESDSRTLANEVVELELTYLEMSEKVDASLASKMGFKEVQASFATRKSLGRATIGEPLGSVKSGSNGF